MPELENKIIPSKYGNPGDTEWTFGAGYEMVVSVPTQITVLRKIEGNDYVPSIDPLETTSETNETRLKRARLTDLFPLVDKALENGHEFTIQRIADGRSGNNNRHALDGRDMLSLMKHVKGVK